MRFLPAVGLVVRSLMAIVLTWLVAALAAPSADPFVVCLVWMLVCGVVLAVGPARRAVLRWLAPTARSAHRASPVFRTWD
jgi:hypothetical protein